MFALEGYLIESGQMYELLGDAEVRLIHSATEAFEILKRSEIPDFHISVEIANIRFELANGVDPDSPYIKAWLDLGGQSLELSSVLTALQYYCSESVWISISRTSIEDAVEIMKQVGISDVGAISISQAMFMAVQGRRLSPPIFISWNQDALSAPPQIEDFGFLNAVPYPYQKIGYEWLIWLRNMGIGGILGDEMGLGKTLQLIMLLQNEIIEDRTPNLVVCPPSLLENWRRELVRFISCDPYIHQGSGKSYDPDFISSQQIVLISYDALRRDHHYLEPIKWNIVGVDEAQYIKNPDSQRTLAVKGLQKQLGFALTGTPVENSIQDLWSLMDFTCKGLLGNLPWFVNSFSDNPRAIHELRVAIKPTLLRRKVQDVAQDLPMLSVQDIPLNLPLRLYREYLTLSTTPAQGTHEARGRFMQKRKVSNHLLDGVSDFIVDEDDGKMQYLRDAFESLMASKHKGIVFVPFTSALLGLEKWFDTNFHYFYSNHINGTTPVNLRQKIIDEFSSFGGGGVLIINPKAGGVGLNITAANHVFHFSPDWNPAVMDQASARSFRRGQKLPVTIHNMFYEGTVEVDMYSRLKSKRLLAEGALQDSDILPTLEEMNMALARIPSDQR